MQTILVVDDEKKIVDIVKAYLEKAGYTVLTAYNGQEALHLFQANQIDLVVLDLMMPDVTGEEVCKVIREKSDTPVIMLTAKVQEREVLEGFSIGADDYVMKPFSPRQLLARIEAILRRFKPEKQLSGEASGLILDKNSYEVTLDGRKIEMTSTEFKILHLFVSQSKRVFTREEIIESVFGYDYGGYDRTLDSHIKNIRKKLDNSQYIKTVYGIGYRYGGCNE